VNRKLLIEHYYNPKSYILSDVIRISLGQIYYEDTDLDIEIRNLEFGAIAVRVYKPEQVQKT
jgi:hypothetical protein